MLNEKIIISSASKSLKEKISLSSNVNNSKNCDSLSHLQILATLYKTTKENVSKISELSDVNGIRCEWYKKYFENLKKKYRNSLKSYPISQE